MLNDKQLQLLRNQLQEAKIALAHHHDCFDRNESLREQTGELSAYDNHPADIGTELFERSKDLSLLQNRKKELENIESALDRMDRGRYGYCEQCGDIIPFERLEALPMTRYCLKHAPQSSKMNNRPVEEERLQPPFGRTSMDENDSTAFDGEDAWQIVARQGTSDSPAMAEDPNESYDYDRLEPEPNDADGVGVEQLEQFLATDLYGRSVTFVRGKAYTSYMENGEGDRTLEIGNEQDQ